MAAFGEAALTDEVVRASADIAVKVDPDGRIQAVHFGDAFPEESSEAWLGKSWEATVTGETRPKVIQLLEEASARGVARGRQVNHSLPTGVEVPIEYTAIRIGTTGEVLAIGRDLRALSALQHRLIEAQQAMERDYWRLRQMETRYRLLFQFGSEPVLVVNAEDGEVQDANPAAGDAFEGPEAALIGSTFPEEFRFDEVEALERHLQAVRVQGRAEPVRVHDTGDGREYVVQASLVRQQPDTFFLVRLTPAAKPPDVLPSARLDLRPYLEEAPDGVLLIDSRGEVLESNRAFTDMIQLTSAEEVRNQSLDRWIGRPGADLSVLLGLLRSHGVVRLFSSTLRGELGLSTEVEISASSVLDARVPANVVVIRDVGRRLARPAGGVRDLGQAVSNLTELVGRVSLKDLVQDTVELVERHFIEAALELTDDNRTAAAEVLGLSRQSLYSKINRYDLGQDADED